MALDFEVLAGAILDAVKPVLKRHWKDAKNYAETESRKLAVTLENIANLLADGKITREQAKILVEMQAHGKRPITTDLTAPGRRRDPRRSFASP